MGSDESEVRIAAACASFWAVSGIFCSDQGCGPGFRNRKEGLLCAALRCWFLAVIRSSAEQVLWVVHALSRLCLSMGSCAGYRCRGGCFE